MRYFCDYHKNRTALWVCADCDGLYCSDCVDKRTVRQHGKNKPFHFCPKCNIEAERLSSGNPLRTLLDKLSNLIPNGSHHLTKKTKTDKHSGNTLLSRVDALVENGDTDDALVLMENERNDISSDIDLAERYYKILKSKNRTDEMLAHGSPYLELLARKGVKERLCEVYMECVSASPDFSASSFASFKVAGSMIEAGNLKEAVDVYQGFIKNNPENPMVPNASFQAAKIINERLKDPQKAVEILEDTLKRYPNHEIAPYMRQYLERLNV